jgi:hypothetical protein
LEKFQAHLGKKYVCAALPEPMRALPRSRGAFIDLFSAARKLHGLDDCSSASGGMHENNK